MNKDELIKHIENVSEKVEKRLTWAQYKQILYDLSPFGIALIVLHILYNIMQLTALFSGILMVITFVLVRLITKQIKRTNTQPAKSLLFLILTFRHDKGGYFSDFAPIESVKQGSDITLNFKDFPYFNSMRIKKKCDWNELLIFTPQTVLYKNWLVEAKASPIDVKLLDIQDGVPVVESLADDYEV